MGKSFFNNYKLLCEKKGVSPNGAAKANGKSSGSVTAWKNGVIPRSDTLMKLAEYFDVSVADLLGDDLQTISEESHKIRNDLIFEVKETRIKNSPEPQSEERGNVESLPADYFKLNKENRAAIDDLIAKLASGQSQP